MQWSPSLHAASLCPCISNLPAWSSGCYFSFCLWTAELVRARIELLAQQTKQSKREGGLLGSGGASHVLQAGNAAPCDLRGGRQMPSCFPNLTVMMVSLAE